MKLSELVTLSPIAESAMSNLHLERTEALENSIKNEYGCDSDMAESIAQWLLNNGDDDSVEEFLHNHYVESGELKSNNDEYQNWLADHVSHVFADEMKGL